MFIVFGKCGEIFRHSYSSTRNCRQRGFRDYCALLWLWRIYFYSSSGWQIRRRHTIPRLPRFVCYTLFNTEQVRNDSAIGGRTFCSSLWRRDAAQLLCSCARIRLQWGLNLEKQKFVSSRSRTTKLCGSSS